MNTDPVSDFSSLQPASVCSKLGNEEVHGFPDAKENEQIWWPPAPVLELARLAFDSGTDHDSNPRSDSGLAGTFSITDLGEYDVDRFDEILPPGTGTTSGNLTVSGSFKEGKSSSRRRPLRRPSFDSDEQGQRTF